MITTNTLVTIAIAANGVLLTVIAWCCRRTIDHGTRLVTVETKIKTTQTLCSDCRTKLSDVTKTGEQMKVVFRSQKEQSENVASALTLLSEQGKQITTVQDKLSHLDTKVDTLVELVRNGRSA